MLFSFYDKFVAICERAKNTIRREWICSALMCVLFFLGFYYLYTACHISKIQLIYDSDKPIEQIVFIKNEAEYFDIYDIMSGNNRKLSFESGKDIESLVINPRTSGNGELLLRKIQFLNQYDILFYEIKDSDTYEYLFEMANAHNGCVRYVEYEGLYYSWDEGGNSTCELGSNDSWMSIALGLNRRTCIITFVVECIWTALVGLLALFLLHKDSKVKRIALTLDIIIVSFVFAFLWAYSTLGSKAVVLGMFFILLIIWIDYRIIVESRVSFKEGAALLFLMSISFGILLTISYYLFADEIFLGGRGEPLQSIRSLFTFGRVFQLLTDKLFSFVTYDTIGIYRLGLCTQAYIYSLYIYSKIRDHTKNKVESFMIAGLLCCSSAMVDCVAYTAINTYTLSLCMMIYSFLLYEQGNKSERKGKKILYYFSCVFMVLLACHAYQLGITIIFLFTAIDLWYSETIKTLLKYLKYVCLMVSGVVAYYGTFYCYSLISGNNVAFNRGGIIGFDDIVGKIRWFSDEVMSNAIFRCIATLSGRHLFVNKLFWGKMVWKENAVPAQIGIGIFILICLVGICYKAWKEKFFLKIISLIALIPASYGVMLVLKENGYHTYYALPLISILAFYFIESMVLMIKNGAKNKKAAWGFLMCILLLTILQSMLYVRCAWCSYEKIVDYVKIILTTNDTKRIHVYGGDYWGTNPIYGGKLMQNLLEQTGRSSADYIVTLSEKAGVCNRVWPEEYDLLLKNEMIDENVFLQYYEFDMAQYGYVLKVPLDLDKIPDGLEELFGQTEDCIIIDLNWSVHL